MEVLAGIKFRKITDPLEFRTIQAGNKQRQTRDHQAYFNIPDSNITTVTVSEGSDTLNRTFNTGWDGKFHIGVATQGEGVESFRHAERINWSSAPPMGFDFYSFPVRWMDYEPNTAAITANAANSSGSKRQALVAIANAAKAKGMRIRPKIDITRLYNGLSGNPSDAYDDGTNFYTQAMCVRIQDGAFVKPSGVEVGSPPSLAGAVRTTNAGNNTKKGVDNAIAYIARVVDHLKDFVNDGTFMGFSIVTSSAAELEYDFDRGGGQNPRFCDTDFNDDFVDSFRTWLLATYTNLANINALWGTSYASINDICTAGDRVNFRLIADYNTLEPNSLDTPRRITWRHFRDHVLAEFVEKVTIHLNTQITGLTQPVTIWIDQGSSWDSLSTFRGSQNPRILAEAAGQYFGAKKQNDAANYPHRLNALKDSSVAFFYGGASYNEVQEGMNTVGSIKTAVTQWFNNGYDGCTVFGVGEVPPTGQTANTAAISQAFGELRNEGIFAGQKKRLPHESRVMGYKYSDLLRFGHVWSQRGTRQSIQDSMNAYNQNAQVFFWDDSHPSRTIYSLLTGVELYVTPPSGVSLTGIQLLSDNANDNSFVLSDASTNQFNAGMSSSGNALMSNGTLELGRYLGNNVFMISLKRIRDRYPELIYAMWRLTIQVSSAQTIANLGVNVITNVGGTNGYTLSPSAALDGTRQGWQVIDNLRVNAGTTPVTLGWLTYRRDIEECYFRPNKEHIL